MHGEPEPDSEAATEPRGTAARWQWYAVPVVLLCVTGLGLLLFAHSEPGNARRGSLAYLIGIPVSVKAVPVQDDCKHAVYAYTARDGERIGAARINYDSTLPEIELRALYDTHFDALNCTRAENEWRCQDGNTHSIRIADAASAGCRSVEIFILGDFE